MEEGAAFWRSGVLSVGELVFSVIFSRHHFNRRIKRIPKLTRPIKTSLSEWSSALVVSVVMLSFMLVVKISSIFLFFSVVICLAVSMIFL